MFLLIVLGYVALMAGVAALLQVVKPAWPTARILFAANIPGPFCVLLLAVAGVASIGPAAPGEIDAGGMAIAFYMIAGLTLAITMLALGVPAGWLVLRRMRRER